MKAKDLELREAEEQHLLDQLIASPVSAPPGVLTPSPEFVSPEREPGPGRAPQRMSINDGAVLRDPRLNPAFSSRTRRRAVSAYEKLGRTGALAVVVILAIFLWRSGAIFTLKTLEGIPFLSRLDVNIAAMGPWKWAIPAGMSLIEVFFWPKRDGRLRNNLLFFWPTRGERIDKHLLFLAVLLFDIGTTCLGAVEVITGERLTLDTLSTGANPIAIGFGLIFGFMCAVMPERLLRLFVQDLCDLWLSRNSWLSRTLQRGGLIS